MGATDVCVHVCLYTHIVNNLTVKFKGLIGFIHELGSIPSSKQRGALRSCIKWKAIISRWKERVDCFGLR